MNLKQRFLHLLKDKDLHRTLLLLQSSKLLKVLKDLKKKESSSLENKMKRSKLSLQLKTSWQFIRITETREKFSRNVLLHSKKKVQTMNSLKKKEVSISTQFSRTWEHMLKSFLQSRTTLRRLNSTSRLTLRSTLTMKYRT